MYLEYIGHRDFQSDDGKKKYPRECFVNPNTDKVYAIDTDIQESGCFEIVKWDYSKNGLKIKQIRKVD